MKITKETKGFGDMPTSFNAECDGWDIYAKWDGCVEFRRQGEGDFIHVCDLPQFANAVAQTKAEMEKRGFEL